MHRRWLTEHFDSRQFAVLYDGWTCWGWCWWLLLVVVSLSVAYIVDSCDTRFRSGWTWNTSSTSERKEHFHEENPEKYMKASIFSLNTHAEHSVLVLSSLYMCYFFERVLLLFFAFFRVCFVKQSTSNKNVCIYMCSRLFPNVFIYSLSFRRVE